MPDTETPQVQQPPKEHKPKPPKIVESTKTEQPKVPSRPMSPDERKTAIKDRARRIGLQLIRLSSAFRPNTGLSERDADEVATYLTEKLTQFRVRAVGRISKRSDIVADEGPNL